MAIYSLLKIVVVFSGISLALRRAKQYGLANEMIGYFKEKVAAVRPWAFQTPGLTLLYALCHAGSILAPGTYGSKALADQASVLYDEIRAKHSGTESLAKKLRRLTNHYNEIKAEFTSHEQERIDDVIQRLEADNTRTKMSMFENMLRLPRVIRPISPTEEGEDFRKMMQESGYPLNLQMELYRYVALVATSLKYDTHLPRAAPLLIGPPGVGKTRLFEKMAANLRMPILKVNIPKDSSPHNYIFGEDGVIVRFLAFQKEYGGGDVNQYPVLVQLEEADKVLNGDDGYIRSFFLDILEGGEDNFRESSGLNWTKLYMKYFIFVMCANEEIKVESKVNNSKRTMEKDEAFASRVCEIHVSAYTQQEKEGISKQMTKDILRKLKREKVSVTTNARIQKLVKEDNHPGVRVLRSNITMAIVEEVAKEDGWKL